MTTSAFIPDKFTLYNTVWNTDVDLDTSVYLSADASLKFLDSAPANDSHLYGELVPTIAGDIWLVDAVARAARVNAGDTMNAGVAWFDSTKTYVGATEVFSDKLPAIDTWYTLSGSVTIPSGVGAAWAAPRYIRSKAVFVSYLDTLGMRKVQPGFRAFRSSTQSINTASATKVAYDQESYDYGSVYDAATNYRFTCVAAGPHLIAASAISAQTLVSGNFASMSIYKNGAFYAYTFDNVASTRVVQLRIVEPMLLALGDYIEIYIYHDYGSARTWLADENYGSFSATKI